MGIPVTTVTSTETKGAGSVLQISVDDGTTFLSIKGITTIPQVGEEGSFIETTSIDDTTRRYIDGIRTPPEFEMSFADIADDADQQTLIDAADAGDTIKVKVTYANGRVADFDLVIAGHYAADTELEGMIMHAIKGQVSGSVAWSKVA